MNNMNWDFKDLDLDNKEERNISIGKSQIGNENLSSFLMKSADNLVDFYLKENNIDDCDVIVTQRDGFIIAKMLGNIDEFITMEYRGFIDFAIISLDRTKYLAVMDDEVDVKGVPHKYDQLDRIYSKFANLNFYDKKILFSQLQAIKNAVLECDDKKFFMIPRSDKFVIVTNQLGTLEVQNEDIFSIDDINKMRYFQFYFQEFLDPIYLEFY